MRSPVAGLVVPLVLLAACLSAASDDLGDLDIQQLLDRAHGGNIPAQMLMAQRYREGVDVVRSQDMASWWYRQAAEQGHALAQLALARRLRDGVGLEPSPQDAARWFRQAAEQGLPEAQYAYADMILADGVVDVDAAAALDWLQRAALQGHVDAALRLGRLSLAGRGTAVSQHDAFRWFARAAAAGNAAACHELAGMYRRGEAIAASERMARHWEELAAEREHAPAQLAVAEDLLFDGPWPSSSRSVQRGMRLLHAAAAAGLPAAERRLASCYLLGQGVAVDRDRAHVLLRQAHAGGDAPAALLLADLLREDPDVPATERLALVRQAAETGLPAAQARYGVMLEEGTGTEADISTAFTWYRAAAEQEHPEALYRLGQLYQRGFEGSTSQDLAVQFFRRAAAAEHAGAIAALGLAALYGNGLPQDDEVAVAWLRRAAEADEPTAQYHIALLYEQGRGGLEPNLREALLWLRLAAGNGSAPAMLRLGELLRAGVETQLDLGSAREWFARAAAAGLPEAEAVLQELDATAGGE